jgi:calpain-15
MAVVSERPDILEKLFLTKQYNHFGIYEMRLCIDGIWENVIVDDYFPCHKRNRSMVFGVGRKNQLWVSLLEKALAKIYGSYAVLRAGRTVEGIALLNIKNIIMF